MSKKTRAFALLLAAAALLMSLGALSASAAGDVYFTAIGDSLLPLKDETMPFVRSEKYYLPYTVFSDNALGISYVRDVSRYTLTLSDDTKSITFDSLRGYAYDEENRYEAKLAGASGTIFVPIEFVCEYFGLDFQVLDTKPVSILRVADSDSKSAADFRGGVSASLAQKYLDYRMGTTTSPSPSTPPTSGPGVTPTPTPTPTPPPEPVTVCITFDDGPNKYTEQILDTLDDYNMHAAFFLTGSLIDDPARQDTVRRIAGSGHTVGVHSYSHVPEEMYTSPEALTAELERTNEALRRVTGERTRLFRFPYGSNYKDITAEMRDAVIDAGYRYWDWTIDAKDYEQPTARALAESVISDLEGAEPGSNAVILMHDTAITADALPAILEHIENGNYKVELIRLTASPMNFFADER